MKVKNKQGFTLAELLIVMAIIVVLAAVAIPTFGRQLETARETGDMELIRNAYTDAMSAAVIDAADGKLDGLRGASSLTITDVIEAKPKLSTSTGTPPTGTEAIYTVKMADKIKQADSSWQYVNNTINGKTVDVAVKDYQWVNFRFVLDTTSGELTLDDMQTAKPITITNEKTSAYAVKG